MKKQLFVLLAAAFIARIWSVTGNLVVERDSTAYLWMADMMQKGRFAETVRQYQYHPLFPAMIAGGGYITGSNELAGYALAVIFSALAVLFVYKLSSLLCGEAAAAVASLLYIFHPSLINYHNEIMTEPVFVFFFTGCVYFFVSGILSKSYLRHVYALVMFALSFAVRPDSAFLVPLAFLFFGYLIIRTRFDRYVVLTAVGYMVVFVAFHVLFQSLTGRTVSIKGSVGILLESPITPEGIDNVKFLSRMAKGVDYLFLLLLVMSILKLGTRAGILASIAAVNYLIMYLFALKGGWIQTRYFTLSLPFLLLPVADFLVSSRFIAPRILFSVFLCWGVFSAARWEKADLLNLRRAGEYILDTYGSGRLIASVSSAANDRSEGVYYARGIHVPHQKISEAEFIVCRDRPVVPQGFALVKEFQGNEFVASYYLYAKAQ